MMTTTHSEEMIDEVARKMNVDDDKAAELIEAFEECFGTLEDAGNLEDAYCGQWPSEKAYAENFVDEAGILNEMPEELRIYFDYEAYARDLFINDLTMADGGHVFNRHW